MVKPDSPCMGCDHRYQACHSVCEGYLEYRKNLDTFNNNIRSAKKKENSFLDFKISSIKKINKKKK